MTKEEAIKIIEYTFLNADGHLKPLDFDYEGGKGIVEALRMAIEALSQPSLPSNLDEAAEKFARDDAARMWDIENKTEEEIVIAAFKAGAELMACLALTMDDIKLIIKIYNEVLFKSFKVCDIPSEVLKRFNEQRKK